MYMYMYIHVQCTSVCGILYLSCTCTCTWGTSVFLIAIEVEDTLNEVVEKHIWISGKKKMNQTELSWFVREEVYKPENK